MSKKEPSPELLKAKIIHRGRYWFQCLKYQECRPNGQCLRCRRDCRIRKEMRKLWKAMGWGLDKTTGKPYNPLIGRKEVKMIDR